MTIGINGFGKRITSLDGTGQYLRFNTLDRTYYANRVRIYNLGNTNDVLVNVNSSLADWPATALVVPPNKELEICGDGRPPIFSISLKAGAGTTDVVVNAF